MRLRRRFWTSVCRCWRLSNVRYLVKTLVVVSMACVLPLQSHAVCTQSESSPSMQQQYASGWGVDHHNTRYQPKSTIDSTNVERLTFKWAYSLAETTPRSWPLVTEDTIFIGDGGRGLVALDRETGCERWVYPHEGAISTAVLAGVVHGQAALIFGDRTQGIYAVYADSGKLAWHAQVKNEPVPWYSGTPLVTETLVFVPIASMEVVLAANPLYGCCTTSGGMAALDINTGEVVWYLPTIEAAAQVTGRHWWFVEEHGPSGASVWGAPSYDAERNWVFFGTGLFRIGGRRIQARRCPGFGSTLLQLLDSISTAPHTPIVPTPSPAPDLRPAPDPDADEEKSLTKLQRV